MSAAAAAEDTIFALSSGSLPAAIAVVRVSGPAAHAVACRLVGQLPPARVARLCNLREPDTSNLIDQALVIRFDEPASATGEDLVEFQCHGGRATVDALLHQLSAFPGMRAALPGEFTRRALVNGRMDLTEAEGLADLLAAETELQRRSALAMSEGSLRHSVDRWQDRLVTLSAMAEALIDYDEEGDVTVGSSAIIGGAQEVAAEIGSALAAPSAERLRDGVRIVIAGPVNAGKSSLFNSLVGSDRAIVTAIPGTTRDSIEMPLAIAGIPLLLVDTAGQRAADDLVEQIGIERAEAEVASADIVLWLGSPEMAPERPQVIQLAPKSDLAEADQRIGFPVSAQSGEGVEALIACILDSARSLLPREGEVALNRRQRGLLEEARRALISDSVLGPELLAENLRHARNAFHRLTGRAGIEETLDALFGRFCLGK